MMKNKQLGLLLIILLFVLAGCSKVNIDNVFQEPNFGGTIEEAYGNSVLIKVNDGDSNIDNQYVKVSLDLKLKGSLKEFKPGDKVRVYYDGKVAESYPLQVNNAYTIMLSNPN